MNRPFAQGDRVWTPLGWAELDAIYNNDPAKNGQWQVVLEGSGRYKDYRTSDIRHETFREFLWTRKTGFGKTSWQAFGVIQIAVFGCIVSGIATWNDSGWIGIVSGLVVEGVFILGSYFNYTKRWV